METKNLPISLKIYSAGRHLKKEEGEKISKNTSNMNEDKGPDEFDVLVVEMGDQTEDD